MRVGARVCVRDVCMFCVCCVCNGPWPHVPPNCELRPQGLGSMIQYSGGFEFWISDLGGLEIEG